MKILALEFSSSQRSVAVFNPATGSIAHAVDTSHGHTMKPFGLIEDVLRQAQLEREQIEVVAVGLGPGSYTGIRTAIALAQGWQLAQEVKLCGLSSADCLASQEAVAGGLTRINVVVDAQRGEFYLARYEIMANGKPKPILPLQIVSQGTIKEHEQAGEIIIGPHVTKWFSSARQAFPDAATLARLASTISDFSSGQELEPIYLRETTFIKTPAYLVSS